MSDTSVRVIAPGRSGWIEDFRELWRYRELLWFFAWRDIKVRYKQTVLGVAWAILQPVLLMVVCTVFFGRFLGVSSEGIPYPIFAYTALLPWTYFAYVLTQSSQSLVSHRNMITRVYFPRLILPVGPVLSGLVDFAMAFTVLVAMMFFYGLSPGPSLWALPFFLLLAMATALGVGVWLSALNVRYRDVHHVVPFLIQVWFFSTPIIYPIGRVPDRWRMWYDLNPMTGVVEGFRWALLGREAGPGSAPAVSTVVVILLLFSALSYFRHTERTFADVV